MPPRYAYWTILIDDKPTAFRAREREELQPTFVQLQRKNDLVTMRWFARGKLWESREAEQADFQAQKQAASVPRDRRAERAAGVERRGGDWRPGGTHKDPRDRFKKKNRPERAWSEKDPATQRDRDKPGYVAKPSGEWRDKPAGPPRGDRPRDDSRRPSPFGPGEKRPWTGTPRSGDKRPWSGKPRGDRPPAHHSSSDPRRSGGEWSGKPAPPNDRPWQTKPTGPRAQRKPWVGKPSGDRPWSAKPAGEGRRPWGGKPADRSGPPRERKPWSDKASGGGAPRGDRPWQDKAHGKPQGARPWSNKPQEAGGPPRGDRPRQDDRVGAPPRGDRPWQSKSRDPRRSAAGSQSSAGGWSGKPRDPNRKPFTPRGPRPSGGDGPPRKRRDDED